MDNKGFKTIEKGLEQFITKGQVIVDAEVQDQVDITLIELYRYSNNLIRELETSDKYASLTQFEREIYFLKK